uniref:1-acyl-sn-glycerol-3-phosphate acyltransferase 4 n=1 Tax=Arundo donax TaxID=35708 RepID=A0A0A9JFK3_ARUDO
MSRLVTLTTAVKFARHLSVDRSPSVPSFGKWPSVEKSDRSLSFSLNLSVSQSATSCSDVGMSGTWILSIWMWTSEGSIP